MRNENLCAGKTKRRWWMSAHLALYILDDTRYTNLKIRALLADRIKCMRYLASGHPEMVLFPLSCVLRGFGGCDVLHVRLAANPCAALLNEKIAHF
jgi:hypothetical protein